MKKFFISALLAMSLISSAFATDVKNIDLTVTDAFKSQFSAAKDVEWVSRPDYARASFVQNGKKTEVYYKHNGELIGTSSTITVDDLPTAAKRSFAKKYSEYTVGEAIKFETENDLSYYLTAENDKEKVIVQVNRGSFSTFKRTSKN